jgi:ACR3 family arsenite efflux pump ArsB
MENFVTKKELGILDKFQPLFLLTSIIIGLLIAKFLPSLANNLISFVSIGVFLVIFFIMLGIDIKGILNAFKKWKPTTIAILINFLFTPFFAWFLGFLFLRNSPDIWVGLILYLITPCIGWYLIFTELADGDVALGITLLAWNIFLQIALMPLYMLILAHKLVNLNIYSILYSVLIYLLLPFLLSRFIRFILIKNKQKVEDFSSRYKISYFKTIILMIVIISMFASQGKILFKNPTIVIKMILPGLVFFISIFIFTTFVAYLFNLKYSEYALLVFTTTARNSEASLAIAVTAFTNPLIPLTVVIGPSIELPVLIIILNILKFLKTKSFLRR